MDMAVSPMKLRGALLALGGFSVFSSNDVVIKFLGGQYSPFQTIFFSTILGFPLVSILLMRDRTEGNLIPKHPFWTTLRAFVTMLNVITGFYAFAVLPLSECYPIFFATPLLITVLAIPMLGEKVGLHRGGAVLVGLLGVLVVLRPGSGHLGLGHLAAISAAFLGSLNAIIMRKTGGSERFVVMMLYPMVANLVVSAAALPFVYKPMPIQHLGMLAYIAALGMVASLLIISAYRVAPAVIVAPMQYSQIIWATIFGSVVFHESHDFWTIVGTLIIIASGVYIVLREDKAQVSKVRPVLETPARFDQGLMPRDGFWLRLIDRTKSSRYEG
jgi:S-adenosylmethionine uptake transporter